MIKSPAALGKLLPALEGPPTGILPRSMQRAVRLMLSGAGATAVWGIFLVVVTVVNRDQLVGANGKKLTTGQLSGAIVFNILIIIILAALWVLMARMNQRGRKWARIAATGLFALWTYESYLTIGTVIASAMVIIDLVLVLLIWAIGLGALILLWRPESSEYFQSAG
ncbi:MAG: hypothetical protein J2P25_00170 [Nocardiopsaceae bacterium]|nr:hypothetical protein [Nocardiopsaceae bacterium]